MHALVLIRINQRTKCEVHNFNNSKDMIGAQFLKTGHVTVFYLHTKFGDCVSVVLEILFRVSKLKNGSRDPDHDPLGVVCYP